MEAYMNLQIFHHVAIIVSEYERSKHFYTELLGFPILRENYRPESNSWKLDLRFGQGELEIFCFPNSPKRLTYPEACGLRHLSFKTSSIEKDIAELRQMGISTDPIKVDPFTGGRYTFFFDPDGLPLELHE